MENKNEELNNINSTTSKDEVNVDTSIENSSNIKVEEVKEESTPELLAVETSSAEVESKEEVKEESTPELLVVETSSVEVEFKEEEVQIEQVPVEPVIKTSAVKEKVDNTHYNVTLLFSYFIGGLGIHRLINGKKISGAILLVMSLILLPLTLILLTFGIMNDNTALTIVGMVSIPLYMIIAIWVLADFFTIILGKFKNGNNEDVKVSGSFFKSWANVLVIVVIVISIITSAISSVFLADPINNAFQDYLDGKYNLKPTIEVDEEAEAFKKNMMAINDAIYSVDGSGVVFEDYDALVDPVSDHFTNLGYEVDIDKKKDVITFSKNRADIDFIVEIALDETDDGYLIEKCTIGVAIEENDVEYYAYVLTVGDSINDSEEVGYIVSVSSLDPEFFYLGNYKPEEDSVTLLDADSKGNKEYDSEKDEYQIIDTLKEISNELIDEEEYIFDY